MILSDQLRQLVHEENKKRKERETTLNEAKVQINTLEAKWTHTMNRFWEDSKKRRLGHAGEGTSGNVTTEENNKGKAIAVTNSRNVVSFSMSTRCLICRIRAVSILLFPCRHMCICKECDASVKHCPICNTKKQSYMVFVNVPFLG